MVGDSICKIFPHIGFIQCIELATQNLWMRILYARLYHQSHTGNATCRLVPTGDNNDSGSHRRKSPTKQQQQI